MNSIKQAREMLALSKHTSYGPRETLAMVELLVGDLEKAQKVVEECAGALYRVVSPLSPKEIRDSFREESKALKRANDFLASYQEPAK